MDSIVNYELGMIGRGNQICYSNEDSVAGCVHELLSDILSFHKDNEEVIPMWEVSYSYFDVYFVLIFSNFEYYLFIFFDCTGFEGKKI